MKFKINVDKNKYFGRYRDIVYCIQYTEILLLYFTIDFFAGIRVEYYLTILTFYLSSDYYEIKKQSG